MMPYLRRSTVRGRALSAVALPFLLFGTNADAKVKAVRTVITEVDGKSFKVTQYSDNTVTAYWRKMTLQSATPELRDRLRRAIGSAIGCAITDEYFDTYRIRLMGKLRCEASGEDGGHSTGD